MMAIQRRLLPMFAAMALVATLQPPTAAAAPTVPSPALLCLANLPCPPNINPRFFPQTGFGIDVDQFWSYFLRRGGVATFGYPVSQPVRFLGYTTQFFQRQVMQLWPDGSVHLLNLLDAGLMPYRTFNFSVFPASDPELIAAAPSPSDPDYGARALAFIRLHAPDQWQGLPVDFGQTYFGTVSALAAFPNEPAGSAQVQALLPLVQLEVWGLPTSAPAFDPANHAFVYLRFQRGVMMFDASCACTQGVLFGDYLKSIIEDQRIPTDLAQEAAASPEFAQYAPGQPDWLARPAELPDTDLTGAFTPTPVPLLTGGPAGG